MNYLLALYLFIGTFIYLFIGTLFIGIYLFIDIVYNSDGKINKYSIFKP